MNLEIIKDVSEKNPEFPSLLFVHGICHGAWCWKENFLPYFSAKGFPSYALSLRGHGKSEGYESLHSFSLDDYMEDVLELMLTLKEKPVLIGHSMGGAVVQKILSLHPAKVKAVVLLASVPPNGMFKDLVRLIFTNFTEAKQLFLFNRRRNVRSPINLFLSPNLRKDKKEKYGMLLQPESVKAGKNCSKPIITKPINTKVPIMVIGSRKDWIFSEKTAAGIAKFYQSKLVVFDNVSHDMMLDPNWELVADQILIFLREIVHKR